MDTGCRIDEVLTLTKDKVDFDNLLITVLGKGSKERKVPLSPEMRKHLWTFTRRSPGRHVFGTKNDTRMTYRNAYRSVKLCFKACGVTGSHVHPHNLRHTFACHFIKQQGSLVALSRIARQCRSREARSWSVGDMGPAVRSQPASIVDVLSLGPSARSTRTIGLRDR